MKHVKTFDSFLGTTLNEAYGDTQTWRNDKMVNETLFYAFFNGKRIEIEGKDIWDAKQQAITQLKVPKSKVGYLAVVSAESQKNQDFRFESEEITEANDTPKFKIDDVVVNNNHMTVGIVRMSDDKYGEVTTDADGNVDVDTLEIFDPKRHKIGDGSKEYNIAPSTKKEIETKGLAKLK
jgi:hypothetical protein